MITANWDPTEDALSLTTNRIRKRNHQSTAYPWIDVRELATENMKPVDWESGHSAALLGSTKFSPFRTNQMTPPTS